MTPAAGPDDPASLVAHVDGLRALARSLLGDAHLAEDVVQDAMVAAIRRPPAAGVPLGPWLVGVVRNLSRFSLRTDARRLARERAGAPRPLGESPGAIVARAEIHRGLVDALLGLPEPYRATLLHRYFDGEEPTEIARRLGVPAETVRTRVHRGLAMLRDALRGDGDDEAWRAALIPLFGGRRAAPGTAATLAAGGIVMTMKTKAVAALAVVFLALVAYYGMSGAQPAPAAPVAGSDDAAKSDSSTPRRPRSTEPQTAQTTASQEAAAVTAAASDEERSKWPIRVTTDAPGAKVTLRCRLHAGTDPAPETKTADAKGFVGFAAPAAGVAVARFDLVARAEGRATVRGDFMLGDIKIELPIAVPLRGVVHDTVGRPVSRATVKLSDSAEFLGDESPETGEDGTFEAFVGKAGPVSLHVDHRAFVPSVVATEAPTSKLVVVLDRGFEISGRVAFPDGRPVPGVMVSDASAHQYAWTDDDGRYVVSGLSRGTVAMKCDVVREPQIVESGATGVDFVVRRPLARVRLVDVEGRPYRFTGNRVRVHKGDVDVYSEAASGGVEETESIIPGTAGGELLVSAHGAQGERGGASTTFDGDARLHDVVVVIGAKRPTGRLRLLVRCDSGDTPRAVFASVNDAQGTGVAGDARKRLELDAAGGVEIEDVPHGRVEIVATAAGHWTAESLDTYLVAARAKTDVEAGRTVEVVVTLNVGGRVRATVRDADGKPVAPRDLRIMHSSDGEFLDMFVTPKEGGWTTRLDTSPAVLLDAVPAGRYVVRAKMADDEVVEKEVEIAKGATSDIELTTKARR